MFFVPDRLAFSISHGSRTSSRTNVSPCFCRLFTCPTLISKSKNGLLCSIPEICLRGVSMFFHAELINPASAQLVCIRSPVAHTVHPAIQPCFAVGSGPGLLVIL